MRERLQGYAADLVARDPGTELGGRRVVILGPACRCVGRNVVEPATWAAAGVPPRRIGRR